MLRIPAMAEQPPYRKDNYLYLIYREKVLNLEGYKAFSLNNLEFKIGKQIGVCKFCVP